MASLTFDTTGNTEIIINEEMARKVCTIAKAQGTIATGAVLAEKYSDGKLYKYNNAGTDGTENPRFIFADVDLDTTVGAVDFISAVARKCNIFSDKIVGISALNTTQGRTDAAKLEANGIYLVDKITALS